MKLNRIIFCVYCFLSISTSVFSKEVNWEQNFAKLEYSYLIGDYKVGLEASKLLEGQVKSKLGDGHIYIQRSKAFQAKFCVALGKFAEYKTLMTAVVAKIASSSSSDQLLLLRTLNDVSEVYITYYDIVAAEKFTAQAMKIVESNSSVDPYSYNRAKLNYYKIKSTQGFYNVVVSELPPVMKSIGGRINDKETFKDAKGREKTIKFSKEETLLRKKIFADMANIYAYSLIENGEYALANAVLEENQDWIPKNIGMKEASYAHSLYLQSTVAIDKDDYYEAESKLRKAEAVAIGFMKPNAELLMLIEEALIPTLKELEKNKEAQIKNEDVDAKIKNYYGRKSFLYQRNNLIDIRRDILNQDWKKAELSLETFLSDKESVPDDYFIRAKALMTLYEVYMQNNKIEKAEASLFESVSIKKQMMGDYSPVFHMAMLEAAEHYVLFGDQFKLSETIYSTSLEKVVKAQVGHKNRNYAGYNYGQIKLELLTDNFTKATKIAKAMLAETELFYSTTSMEYATCLTNVANVETVLGKYTDADAKLDKAIALFSEKGKASDRLHYAHALESKARLQILLGLYEAADRTLAKSKKLSKKAGIQDVNFTTTSEEIIELNIYKGNYTDTEQFLNEILVSREKKYGVTSSSLIQPLNLLGYLKLMSGNYVESEKFLKRSIDISKAKFGEKSSKYAESTKLLERLFASVGDYEKAEKIGQEVVDIATKVFGKDHIFVAEGMNELALVKHFHKRPKAEIEPLFSESLRIISMDIGETSPPYAEALENAAVFYLENGQHSKALEMLEKSNKIWVSKLGESNTHTARISYIKGDIYYLKKNYLEANTQYLKSKLLYATVFDDGHPGYVEALGKSAQMYYCLGDVKNSVLASEETVDKSLRYLEEIFPTLSERGKAKYWEKIKNDYEFYKTLAFTQNLAYPDMIGKVYNITLRTKSILLSSSIKVKERILKSGDSTLVKYYEEWIEKKETISSLLSLSTAQRKESGVEIPKLENEVEELEKKLSLGSQLFSLVFERKEVYDWRELKKVLKEDEVAIEIIPFRLYTKGFSDTIWYSALSVNSNTKSNPDFILMKNGKEMDGKNIRYFRNCVKFDIDDDVSHDVYWKPIRTLIRNDNAKIYLSVDGVYNQLNLEAIQIPGGDYIINKYNIILISSTRDLLSRNSKKAERKNKNESVTQSVIELFGNPSYYPESYASSNKMTSQLQGAEEEVKKLESLMSGNKWVTHLFLNETATEERVKKLSSPRVFHIATHGFFLEDVKGNDLLDEVSERAVRNPLLRSGLLLRNGGYLLETGNVNEFNREDGILTSYEAMNLGLDNTELVVLSACETGLGEVKLGEGVFGLQRSFLVAGADAVIMSLFKVNDEVTIELMSIFYKRWIETGDKRNAFIEAKKEINKKYNSKKYWAAFLMIGVE